MSDFTQTWILSTDVVKKNSIKLYEILTSGSQLFHPDIHIYIRTYVLTHIRGYT